MQWRRQTKTIRGGGRGNIYLSIIIPYARKLRGRAQPIRGSGPYGPPYLRHCYVNLTKCIYTVITATKMFKY